MVTWTAEPNTANYLSHDGKWRATYVRTINGFATYHVHSVSAPKTQRTMRNAKVVGGLPAHVE